MARIITITSGKGGVGKTGISLNLSLALAARGYRVCLFDADLGLANVNILTGIYPKQDLSHVIDGQAGLKEIMIKDFQGIDIIPGSSGVEKLANLTKEETRGLIRAFLSLDAYDYFIFDTSAGISSQVLSFCMASNEIILVATCEPTAITDAYSMLKALSKNRYDSPVKVVINQVKTGKAAKQAFSQLKETVNRFLSVKLEPLGIVGWDKSVRMAVVSQTPFLLLFPDSLAAKCIQSMADKLVARPGQDMPLELFWDRCLSFIDAQPKEKEVKKDRANTPPANSPAGTPPPSDTGEQTAKAIARIEKTLDTLVEEVAQIRTMLESERPPADDTMNLPPLPSPPKPEKITLDFESWLMENKA